MAVSVYRVLSGKIECHLQYECERCGKATDFDKVVEVSASTQEATGDEGRALIRTDAGSRAFLERHLLGKAEAEAHKAAQSPKWASCPDCHYTQSWAVHDQVVTKSVYWALGSGFATWLLVAAVGGDEAMCAAIAAGVAVTALVGWLIRRKWSPNPSNLEVTAVNEPRVTWQWVERSPNTSA